MRRISLNRYDAISYLDEFEDHCLTLKNAPHAIMSFAAYETLVKEDQARSTPDTLHHTSNIRRITIKISQVIIQDGKGHAPHTRTELRRIFWWYTNIPEYINLGPHAKLCQCAASTYSMRRILPSDRNYKYPKDRRI